MFNSPREYLAYLQSVLTQDDADEFFKDVDKLRAIGVVNRNDANAGAPISVSERLPPHQKKALADYLLRIHNLEIDTQECDDFILSGAAGLEIIVRNILNKLSPNLKRQFERIAIGSFRRLNASCLVFKHDPHIVILVSSGLLQLIWNNISLLEATANPAGVVLTDFAVDASTVEAAHYAQFHVRYLDAVREYNLIHPVEFTFDDFSSEMVYQHVEIVFAFIILHEFSHVMNDDLDGAKSGIRHDAELKADIDAISHIEDYLANHPYPLNKIEIVQMVEYYFFRLLHFCDITSASHPSPRERAANLFSQLHREGLISGDELASCEKLFEDNYGDEHERQS